MRLKTKNERNYVSLEDDNIYVDDNICDICKKADGKLNAIVSCAKNVY